jgi:hypothetical protein
LLALYGLKADVAKEQEEERDYLANVPGDARLYK